MRKFLLAAFFSILFAIPAFTKPQANFSDNLSKATLAVYSGKQVCQYDTEETFFGLLDFWGCKFKSRFTCTATVVGKDGRGNYVGLTAGHCFSYDQMDKLKIKYYVSDSLDENPVLNEISLVKFESDARYDYATFTFRSLRDYPVVEILRDGEAFPSIGTPVLNANFSLGVVKQVAEGKVVSKEIQNGGGAHCDHQCGGRYFVSIGIGPGASGSAVVDAKTHKIIGMVELVFPSTQMATLVMPMGTRFVDFMDDASAGIKPEAPPENKNVRIHPVPKKTFIEVLWQVIRKLWS